MFNTILEIKYKYNSNMFLTKLELLHKVAYTTDQGS